MAKNTLTAMPLLDVDAMTVGPISITPTEKTLVAVAVSNGKGTAFSKAVKSNLKLEVPKEQQMTQSADGTVGLMPVAPSQYFLVTDTMAEPQAWADQMVGDSGWCTDQSDAWVGVQIEGEGVDRVLERLVPVDLSPEVLPPMSVVRTSLSHFNVLLLRDSEQRYTLWSAASSGLNFYEHISATAQRCFS